ncbi:MAG: transglutaminase domain-containing protein, partial [Bradyrhizobiaceae bacterium]|nr:transglutaminase domain-containing protein [Bradyrhizobiaceae bacterium]
MTAPGRHAGLLANLPRDPSRLAPIVQGLLIYEHVAADFYGVPLSDKRRCESHIRPVERLLDCILAMDDRPLEVARPASKRLVGICRHYAVLTVAMLRAQGVPARVRCGFGDYFDPASFEDHWVCEYWNGSEHRWIIIDPQFDDVWNSRLNIRHDVLDVPRDRFLTASDAWRACRSGTLDASKFGIGFARLRGLWFISGSLVRDVAALNKIEILPWDVWGAQPLPNSSLNNDQLAFLDQLAELTCRPDETFGALRALYQSDDRVRVPGSVFNALKQRPENVIAA